MRHTPPRPSDAEALVDRLIESVNVPPADELVAQVRFVLESALGHPVTRLEARAFVAGCSYVGQAARLVGLSDKALAIVDAAVDAATSVGVGVAESIPLEGEPDD